MVKRFLLLEMIGCIIVLQLTRKRNKDCMALQKINKQNISDIVFDQLEQQILSGEWKSGEKIPSETALANQLGVSRVSIRDAFQRLKSMGLIESRQGGGTFVCDYSSAETFASLKPILEYTRPDLKYFMEFRNIIEPEMAAIAATRVTQSQLRRMRKDVITYNEAASERHYNEAREADVSLHCTIAKATGNPLVIKIYEMMQDIYNTNITQIIDACGNDSGVRFHDKIVEAIATHDSDQARMMMRMHLLDSMEMFFDSLKSGAKEAGTTEET